MREGLLKYLVSMRRLLSIIVFFPLFTLAQQNPAALDIAGNINKDDICEYVNTLASDNFAGRETGKESLKIAAGYIADKFKEFGLTPGKFPSHFQNYELKSLSTKSFSLSIDGVERRFFKDYFIYPGEYPKEINSSKLVFAGYGIKDEKWDDYTKLNIEGQAVMVLGGEPLDKSGNSVITGSKNFSPWSRSRKKINHLSELKPSVIFYVLDDFKKVRKRAASVINSERLIQVSDTEIKIPVIYISEKTAGRILDQGDLSLKNLKSGMQEEGKGIRRELQNVNISVRSEASNEILEVPNVFAYIEGSDLRDELIIISAHYDHLGKEGNKIYNGADDNASGTSALISIAKAYGSALSDGIKPRRSVLLLAVSGEEKGLLGSEYYVNNPMYPLENTVANLNIDMIGRWDDAHKGNDNYVYLIGSDRLSSDLHRISESANKTYTGLELDYRYNAKNDPNMFYYRSDHYNFAKKGIPVIFYFSGVHKDYHEPSDVAGKIMCPKVEKIAKLVFHTSWELANRTKRPEVDEASSDD